MNLTKFNCHANIAYISAYAAPDLYSSFVYVACTHIKNSKGTDVGVEHLFSHVVANILGIHVQIHHNFGCNLGQPQHNIY